MSSDDIDDKTALEALISSAEANEKSKLPPSKRGVNGSRWDRGSSYEPNNRNYNNRNHHQGNYNNNSRDHNYRGAENNGYRNRDRDNYGRNFRGNDLYENNSRKRVVTDSEYSDSNKSNRNKRRWGEDSRNVSKHMLGLVCLLEYAPHMMSSCTYSSSDAQALPFPSSLSSELFQVVSDSFG